MIYTDLDTLSAIVPEEGTAAALGNFDGLHAGHREVIRRASTSGLFCVAVTFQNNPKKVMGAPVPLLQPKTLRSRTFAELGVRAVLELDFETVRSWPPETFFDALREKLKVRHFVCGYNYRFGTGGTGTAEMLQALAEARGARCTVVPPVTADGETVSSTRIRRLVTEGRVDKAAELLGRPFAYDFPVVHGDGRGRVFGFPTANQPFPEDFVLPAFGVYASETRIDGKLYPSVTNVGIRPMFRTENPLSETYVHGFSGDLYGRCPEVRLLRKLRDEIAFDSAEALIEQMKADLEQSLRPQSR